MEQTSGIFSNPHFFNFYLAASLIKILLSGNFCFVDNHTDSECLDFLPSIYELFIYEFCFISNNQPVHWLVEMYAGEQYISQFSFLPIFIFINFYMRTKIFFDQIKSHDVDNAGD